MIGCGMQQARSAVMEKPVEVVRNGKDGTRRAVGTARPKWKMAGSRACSEAPFGSGSGHHERTPMERRSFSDPKRGSAIFERLEPVTVGVMDTMMLE